jgi:hydroxymethylpyrimidine kinase/phosphomethylpyrimidine kinase
MEKTILTIAGSDCSGGAGIQADLKTISALGAYGATVVTAITAQNTQGVDEIEGVDPALVRAQLEAVFNDLDIAAVKSGMLFSEKIVRTVAAVLRRLAPRIFVCDPVLQSATGYPLTAAECRDVLREELFRLATLVTPNIPEAETLTGFQIRNLDQAAGAAKALLESGAKAVLVKGGHLEAAPATDLLVTTDEVREFAGSWVDSPNTHGTGCTYSSAITTYLATGLELPEAITRAKRFVEAAIRNALVVGRGPGPVNPFFDRHPGA